jgi:hypothetical protein
MIIALLGATTNARASECPECNHCAPPCPKAHCADSIGYPQCDSSVPPQTSPDWNSAGGAEILPESGDPIYQPPSATSAGVDGSFEHTDAFDTTAPTLPGGLGAVATAESPAVHMIGDFFGSGYFLGGMDGFATVPAAGGDRRFKATDNINPLPQNRLFFNYHHFHNAVSDIAGVNQNVDRFTFGLERTFLDEMMSLEVRVPFASGLDSVQVTGLDDTITSEFGNIALTVKILLHQCGSLNFTSGLATVLPTAEDASVAGDTTLTVLENNAVHLQPYLGVNYSNACSRFFSSAYIATDVDLNGNALSTGLRSAGTPAALTPLGDVRDQTLLFFDWQIGYWLYQDYGHIGYLNGFAPVFELHYSRALEEPQLFTPDVMGNPFGKADLLNLTAGLVFDFRRAATLTVYGAAPLRREKRVRFGRTVSPVFQAEFGVQCVYRY